MIDVCLVVMPYSGVDRPSLGVGILKSVLHEKGITTKVLYPNIWFAEEVGMDVYQVCNEIGHNVLLWEWTFAGVAFPENTSDYSEYLKFIETYFNRYQDIKEIFAGRNFSRLMWEIRERSSVFIDRVTNQIIELQPRIVGCSSTFQQNCTSLALLRRIREQVPGIITIMGGANCEGPMGQVMQREFPWVDFAVSGEADELIYPLCRKLLDRGLEVTNDELPYGVIGPDARDPVYNSPPRAVVHDINNLPIPDFDDYFQTLKSSSIAAEVRSRLLVETSRGCWWGEKKKCTFCGLNGEGVRYRLKTPARAVDEFAQLADKYNIRAFEPVDTIIPMSYFDTVLPIFAELEEPYIIFYEIRSNLKRSHMERLSQAGVNWLRVGIESLHDDALKLLNKGNNVFQNVQVLKWARNLGLYALWLYLFDIPGDSDDWYAEAAGWLPLISHLQPPFSFHKVQFHRFSQYHDQPSDFGLNLIPVPWYSLIYPLKPETLNDLAYYFIDTNDPTPEIYFQKEEKIDRPGLNALKDEIIRWQDVFWSKVNEGEQPILTMVDNGTILNIRDTRPCAVKRDHTLEGLTRDIYILCDEANSRNSLLKKLKTQLNIAINPDEVELKLNELRANRLILDINEKVLSLAIENNKIFNPFETR